MTYEETKCVCDAMSSLVMLANDNADMSVKLEHIAKQIEVIKAINPDVAIHYRTMCDCILNG